MLETLTALQTCSRELCEETRIAIIRASESGEMDTTDTLMEMLFSVRMAIYISLLLANLTL